VTLADGAVGAALREAGLDEAAVAGAAREALRDAGFRLGDGSRAHHALVSVASVRFVPGGSRGPRVEVAVEIALAPAGRDEAAPRRDAGTGSAPLAAGRTPREAWLGALATAARRAADAHALAFAAEDKPAPELIRDLDAAGDPRVREHAVRVLGERRTREAVPALIRRLGDGEPRVAHRAVAALAQIGDERAVGPLIDLTRDGDPALGARLLRYVGDIGGREAEGYLLTVEAGHPDPRFRAAAREALEELSARAKDAPVAARK
jgi:hypothetical protein